MQRFAVPTEVKLARRVVCKMSNQAKHGHRPVFNFAHKFEWALPPAPPPPLKHNDEDERRLYAEHFRWVRRGRVAGSCAPYRLAHDIGWVVRSPVDIQISPIEDISFEAPHDELPSLAQQSGFDQIWNRENVCYGIRTEMPLRMYDFQTEAGWEAMFIVNGERSVEWRLGFTVMAPDNWGLLIMDEFGEDGVGIIPGILAAKQLNDISESIGFSLAFRPAQKRLIARGQPIARLIPIHLDGMRMSIRNSE